MVVLLLDVDIVLHCPRGCVSPPAPHHLEHNEVSVVTQLRGC